MLRPTPTLLALTVALAVGLLYPTSVAVPAGPAKDQPAGKAKDQPAGKAKDQPKATPQLTPTARGQKILDDYFRRKSKRSRTASRSPRSRPWSNGNRCGPSCGNNFWR
jgi:hypothetical protein